MKAVCASASATSTAFRRCLRSPPLGRPLGVAVFVRLARERFVVLHLGVAPRLSAAPEINTRVLLKLMHEIRGAARRTRGVDRIELVYKDRHAVRLHVS